MDQVGDRTSDEQLVELTADIAVFGRAASSAPGDTTAAPEMPKPAVPVKKSVTDDPIICREDGKAFKSLKRHLMTRHDLTPHEYRALWGLPADDSMVAPSYAAARSQPTKQMELESKRADGCRADGA